MKTISIYPDIAPTGCGVCPQGKDTPNCQRVLDQAELAPQLSGPSDEVDRLMAALGIRLGFTTEGDLPAGPAGSGRWMCSPARSACSSR